MLKSMRRLFERPAPTERANAPLAVGMRLLQPDRGVGGEWQSPVYGEYYARSADVYAAVKAAGRGGGAAPAGRADAGRVGSLARRAAGPSGATAPRLGQPVLEQVGVAHRDGDVPVPMGLGVLVPRAFGAGPGAFRTRYGRSRPDRVRVVRDARRYISGFVYTEAGQDLPMLPEEVVWFRYFNPLEEFSGLSPMAAARLTADMGIDALRFNREFFRNGGPAAGPRLPGARAGGPTTRWRTSTHGWSSGSRVHRGRIGPSSQATGGRCSDSASTSGTWSGSRACGGAWRAWRGCSACRCRCLRTSRTRR